MSQPVLSQLNSYPLKSAGGISLANSNLDQRGLVHDRRWMVVDDSGQFMSQRTSPEMALINTEIDGQTLILNAPRMSNFACLCFPQQVNRRKLKSGVTAVRHGPPIRR